MIFFLKLGISDALSKKVKIHASSDLQKTDFFVVHILLKVTKVHQI